MRFKVSLYCFVGMVVLFCSWAVVGRTLRPPASSLRVITWHNDNGHTGQYLRETTLTPLNVNSNSFGKLGSYAVDGQIYAQPLYWPGLRIPRFGIHNVLFVATENDSVYAFDADTPGAPPFWHVNFTAPPLLFLGSQGKKTGWVLRVRNLCHDSNNSTKLLVAAC